MSHAHYERLSAMDASLFGLETPNAHMHIGSVSILHEVVEAVRGELEALHRAVTDALPPAVAHRPVEAEARAKEAGAGR